MNNTALLSTVSNSRPEADPLGRRRSRLRRVLLGLGIVAALLLLAVGVAAFWFHGRMQASLPHLDGERALAGLGAPVVVERDGRGMPMVRGESRPDVARALGYLHAQDRFFQMDLLRRRAAGELSELFGAEVLEVDRANRLHRFRATARRALAAAAPEDRALLDAYTAGVNAGLADLGAPPFEYVALRTDPAPWHGEDTYLVVLSMFLELQSQLVQTEESLTRMEAVLPGELFRFLTHGCSEWEAPLELPSDTSSPGSSPSNPSVASCEPPPLPGPEVVNLVRSAGAVSPNEPWVATADLPPTPGSNGWAVSAEHGAGGRALLASDPHLPLGVPNIWYPASLVWTAGGEERRVTGATLPGTPLVVLGSNGRLAWGFTNAMIDTSDLVRVQPVPGDPDRYLTPDGPEAFERIREIIRLPGGKEVEHEVTVTRWGPLLPAEPDGEEGVGTLRYAVRWTAHDPEAVNLAFRGMEEARTVEEGVAVAVRSGIPAQNVQFADADGRIAWTLAGRIPRREGFAGRTAAGWTEDGRGWDGYLDPDEVPRRIDPPSGLLWTANNRVVAGEELRRLGEGGYVLAIRARQIRDRLAALDEADEADMLAIQLDDEALFLQYWQDLLLELLTPEAVEGHPRRGEVREVVNAWDGHASVSSPGYRFLRTYRVSLALLVFENLLEPAMESGEGNEYLGAYPEYELPLRRLIAERPRHLLDPGFASWDEALLAAVDRAASFMSGGGEGPLAEATWGRRNTLRARHPFSMVLPLLGPYLDLPAEPLPGDSLVPRVQHPGFGASLRFAVSPGHEEEGYLHMPGGQSGHPLSPYYRSYHRAWRDGEPTPFLPGQAEHTLRLVPAGGS